MVGTWVAAIFRNGIQLYLLQIVNRLSQHQLLKSSSCPSDSGCYRVLHRVSSGLFWNFSSFPLCSFTRHYCIELATLEVLYILMTYRALLYSADTGLSLQIWFVSHRRLHTHTNTHTSHEELTCCYLTFSSLFSQLYLQSADFKAVIRDTL